MNRQAGNLAVVDDQGEKVNTYYYSPRGVTVPTEKVPQPNRFAGGYQDPTGLYHLSARYMDPRTGRFTQPDPSGLQANPYLYATGDPTNKIDPSGLFGWDEFWSTLSQSITVGSGFGATGGCLVAGTMTGGIGCPAGAVVGGGWGLVGGTVIGTGLGIWKGWGK